MRALINLESEVPLLEVYVSDKLAKLPLNSLYFSGVMLKYLFLKASNYAALAVLVAFFLRPNCDANLLKFISACLVFI